MYHYTQQKYAPDEWHRNNYRVFVQTENARSECEQIRDQSEQLMQGRGLITKAVQEATGEKLAEKARETREWKNKLERTLEVLVTVIEKLEEIKHRLHKSLVKSDKCLFLVNECIDCRNQRLSTDLVDDGVNAELQSEATMIDTFRKLNYKFTSEVDEQVTRSHAAIQVLERDWSDKWEAYEIDAACCRFSDPFEYYPGPESIPSKWSSLADWIKFTRENINLGNIEIEASLVLHAVIENHLRKGADDLQKQAEIVNREFRRRNSEINVSLCSLNEQLAFIGESILKAEDNIKNLRKSILEKADVLKQMQSRMHLRYARPNVEHCDDAANKLLIEESRLLAFTVQSLQEQLVRAEASLRNMLEARRDIEQEMAIKQNSVYIDQTRCPKFRELYPPVHDLLGY